MYNAPVERMYYANVHWLIRVQCALVGGKPAFQWSIEVSAGEGGKGRPQLGRGRLTDSFGAIGPQFFCLPIFGFFRRQYFQLITDNMNSLTEERRDSLRWASIRIVIGVKLFIQPFWGKCLQRD